MELYEEYAKAIRREVPRKADVNILKVFSDAYIPGTV